MDQPRPIETLLQHIHELETALETVNKTLLSRTDREVQVDLRWETRTKEAQTEIGHAFFDETRPKTRSSGPSSKPSTPLSRGSGRRPVKGQILLDESTLNAMDPRKPSAGKSSRGTKGSSPRDFAQNSRAFEISSKHRPLRREPDEPLVMKSVYKHDPSPKSASFLAEDLTNVSPVNSQNSRPHLPSLPKAPPAEIKAFLKQAVSRMKDDFEM